MIVSSDLGRQGGDDAGVEESWLDLSSCLNRYRPFPGSLEVLRSLPSSALYHHPYGTGELLRERYGKYLQVPPSELVPTRGISGAIWALASSSKASIVDVPLPAYTEFLRAFPTTTAANTTSTTTCDLGLVAELMSKGKVVLISNPHNPSGTAHRRSDLEHIALDSPGNLVVDESYVEFVAQPQTVTLVGSTSSNVAVLRSPSKFFGVAGARVGVVWSRSQSLRDVFMPSLGSWPVSSIDVEIATCGFTDPKWQQHMRAMIASDTGWFVALLTANGIPAVGQPAANFVLLEAADQRLTVENLHFSGLHGRWLGNAHGLSAAHVRMSAPADMERVTTKERVEKLRATIGRSQT